MSGRILFDFDGTLLDSSRRIYTLFSELAPESSLSYEEYWRIKRQGINQRDFLRHHFNYTDEQSRQFKEKWMANIENAERLKQDVPFEGVTDFLQQLSQDKTLYLVTARQYAERVATQLHNLGWSGFFTDVFVTGQQQEKSSLVRTKLTCESTDIFVGDTGEDIKAGKELGVKTVAVFSGVLSEDTLKKYQPDLLLDKVTRLVI